MAITWLETDVKYSGSPSFQRCVGYEETGRNSTSVTFKIYLRLKVYGSSSSFYGYGINWKVDSGSWLKVKDSSPRWYGNEGYREFSTSITKSVSASGGGVGFTVAVDGADGSNTPNFSKSYTGNASTFNTAPSWSSNARLRVRENDANGYLCADAVDGTENATKVREDVSKYYVYWDSASDKDNNIKHYELYCQINDGTWNKIYTGSARNYTHNVGGGSSTQGQKLDYYVKAVDSYNLSSPNLNTTQFQKNAVTGANLTLSNGFRFDTTETTLTWAGASNTNGNTAFTYKVNASSITIYNKEKLNKTGLKIKCLKSGTSTDPYILFEDLKKLVSGSNTKEGSFNIELITRNAYGSESKKTAKCYIDLRTDPNPPTSITIGGKTSTSLGSYLLPSKNRPTVSWSGASDKLGGTLTYNVYYKIGSGAESLLSAGTNTSLTLPITSASSSATLGVRVEAVTSYGNKKSASNNSETIHFYNPPSVSIGNMNRTISTVKVDISSKINTSLPNAKFSKQSYTGNGTSGNFTGSLYTATISGLTDASTFDLVATVNDNTGLSSDVKATIKVVPATPKFSVREKGVGVGCVPSGNYALEVSGKANIQGELLVNGKPINVTPPILDKLQLKDPSNRTITAIQTYSGDANGTGVAIGGGGATVIGGGESASNYMGLLGNKADERLILSADNYVVLASNCQEIANRKEITWYDGALKVNTKSVSGGSGLQIIGEKTSGNLWTGSGGFVVQSMGNANLHLGKNSSNDMIFYEDKVAINKKIHTPANGGSWIAGATGGIIRPYIQSEGSFHPLISASTSSNHKIAMGGLGDAFGFYLYDKNRTENGIDGKFTFNLANKRIDCDLYTQVKTLYATDKVEVGGYRDQWQPVEFFRSIGGGNRIGKIGFSSVTHNLSSNDSNVNRFGLRFEAHSSANTNQGLFMSEVGCVPITDNQYHMGVSNRRFKASYCATGQWYSSSKEEKENIVPVDDPRHKHNGLDTRGVILEGIKNLKLYKYNYKGVDHQDVIGFLGQELEEDDKPFLDLIGKSTTTEEGVIQYDINDVAVNGVLLAGLQEALLKIEVLESKLKERGL